MRDLTNVTTKSLHNARVIIKEELADSRRLLVKRAKQAANTDTVPEGLSLSSHLQLLGDIGDRLTDLHQEFRDVSDEIVKRAVRELNEAA